MKICFDSQIFSWQQYGGISRYFFELARHLATELGQEVEILAPFHVNEYLRNSMAARVRGLKVPMLRGTTYAIKGGNLIISLLLMKLRQDVNIFHETYYSAFDCCPRCAKRIVTIHDMIPERFPGTGSFWDRTRTAKARAVQRADHVICVSERTRRDLIELLHTPKGKISVVPLGASLSMPKLPSVPMRRDEPFLLCVGPRAGYKNFERLLRAYAGSKLLRTGFRLVCFGGGRFQARELRLMSRLGISPAAVSHTDGDDASLAAIYRLATALVYPSLYEGFGIPLLEAMSLGCPVVCADTGALPEVAGNAAMFFNPMDESDIRQAIERVVSSPELAADLTRKGMARGKLFSWVRCTEETLAIYQKVRRNSSSRG